MKLMVLLLTNSITYMVMKRCGLDPSEEFNVESFNQITSFDTRQVISRLGAAISDIAEQELREIYSTVINIEKSINNKNYTFVKNNNREYHESKERRSDDYDRSNIQTNGRLSSTTGSITTNEESTSREIFKKEHKKGLYTELMMDGKMEEHLGEIEQISQNRVKQIIKQLAEKFKVNEEMKANNQMEWVGQMNSIKTQAEEIVMQELIYN